MGFFQILKKLRPLLLIAVFLLGSIYLFLHFSPFLTEKAISAYLHKNGFEDFQFKVDAVSTHELLLSSFKFGKNEDLKLSKAKVLYSFKEVLEGKVNSIEITGLSFDFRVKNNKLSSDIMRSLPQGEAKKTGYLPLILPFNKLIVRNSSINIHTPDEKITAALSASIDNTKGNNFIKSDVEIKIVDQKGNLTAKVFVEGSPSNFKGSFNLTAEGGINLAELVDIPQGGQGHNQMGYRPLLNKNFAKPCISCSKRKNQTATKKTQFYRFVVQGTASLKSDISFLDHLLNVQVKEANVSIDNTIHEKKYNTRIEPFQLTLKEDTKAEFQVDFSNSETPDFSYNLQLEPTVFKITVRDKYQRIIPLNINLQEASFDGSGKTVNYKLTSVINKTLRQTQDDNPSNQHATAVLDFFSPEDKLMVSFAGTINNPVETPSIKRQVAATKRSYRSGEQKENSSQNKKLLWCNSIKSDFKINLKGKSGILLTTGYFNWSPSILQGHIDLSAEGEINLAETIHVPAGVAGLKSGFSFQNNLLSLQIKEATLKTNKASDVKKFNARVEPFLIALNKDIPANVLVDFRKNRILISDEISFAPSKIKAIVKDKKGEPIFILFDSQKINVGGELGFPEGKPLDYKIFTVLKESDFSIPEFEVSAEGTSIKAEFSSQDASNKIKISFSNVLIKHDKEPPYIAPLFMKGELNYLNGSYEFDGTIEGFDKKLVLDLSGTYETQSSIGKARFKLFPVLFSKNLISPADIFPVADNIINDVEGEVEAGGTLSWHGKKIKPDIFIKTKNLSFNLAGVNFAGINGAIKLDGIAPLSTPQAQTITISKVEAGLPLENGKIDFNIKSEKIFLETIKWDWAGGTLYADPFQTELTDPKINKLVLNISEVQLDEILSLINRKGLSGTGVLSGKIPVEFFDDLSFSISEGFLEASQEGGVLRYRPAATASFLPGDNQNATILFKALDDFHYKKLKFTLNGGTKKGLEGLLALYGSNPALYDGRSIELNVKLTGEIIEVLESALGIYKIPGQLQEHLLK